MSKYSKLATAPTPQSEPLNERQVKNNAGGFVYQLDDFARLTRFLILGSDAPTYYQSARKLTKENAACVMRCFDLDPAKAIALIVDVSERGRAAKNDAAIFALALGTTHKDAKVRQAVYAAMPKVCRIGTHLFQFVEMARALGKGWGRGMKNAVANWYNAKTVDQVAFQVIKYRQREGYTHKRLMQTAHPDPMKDPKRIALYRWIWGKGVDGVTPQLISEYLYAMGSTDVKDWVKAVRDHNLPWEALPTEANTKPEVWKAMLPNMGLTALIRNLGNMSRVGAITPLSEAEDTAVRRIKDQIGLRKARVHPFNILQAMTVYKDGKGFRGKGEWPVSAPIVDALDEAFELAFENVEPTGKRIFIGLDVSGSMSSPFGGSSLTVAQAAAAMAMVTMRRENRWHVMGFADGLRDLGLTAKQSLATIVRKTAGLTFGGTDCALPMLYALEKRIEADVFMVITDNETWAGRIHPSQALGLYRQKTGIPAKLVVMGMTSTGFTIADPDDAGMLDVVGMDASVPAIVADFIKN